MYVGDRRHDVASIYVGENIINYYDSLNPGSKPWAYVVKQFHEAYRLRPGTLRVQSIKCQQQDNVDCIVFSVANIWAFFMGLDPSRIVFDRTELRSELFKSFKQRKLSFSYNNCKYRGEDNIFEFPIDK